MTQAFVEAGRFTGLTPLIARAIDGRVPIRIVEKNPMNNGEINGNSTEIALKQTVRRIAVDEGRPSVFQEEQFIARTPASLKRSR